MHVTVENFRLSYLSLILWWQQVYEWEQTPIITFLCSQFLITYSLLLHCIFQTGHFLHHFSMFICFLTKCFLNDMITLPLLVSAKPLPIKVYVLCKQCKECCISHEQLANLSSVHLSPSWSCLAPFQLQSLHLPMLSICRYITHGSHILLRKISNKRNFICFLQCQNALSH